MISSTPLAGVHLIAPPRFGDYRGFFSERENRKKFVEAGFDLPEFVQGNHSPSREVGMVQRRHIQRSPHVRGKRMRCGRIFDVAVHVRKGAETYRLAVVLTNCSTNYGPFRFPEKRIPVITSNASAGKPLPICDNGSNARDWLHGEDRVGTRLLIVEKGEFGRSYCIGGESERTNLELVKTLCAILDEKRPKCSGSFADQITFVTNRAGHDARHVAYLRWRPSVMVEDGLVRTVAQYIDMWTGGERFRIGMGLGAGK